MRVGKAIVIFLVGWILGLGSALVLPGTTFPLMNFSQSTEIKIGAVLCLTGICAEWGQESLNGARLAVDTVNQRGGVLGRKLRLVVEDSQEEQTARAVSAFQRLHSQADIKLFLGPTWTPAGLALVPLAGKSNDLIMTSPSLGVKEFNESSDSLFNVWPHDEGIARRLAKYAFSCGHRRAAIFGAEQQWTQAQSDAFSEEFRQLGGQIVGREEPPPTQTQVLTEATRLVQSQPDVLIFTCLGDQEGAAARQLRSRGYAGPFLSVLVDDTTLAASQGSLVGAVFGRYPEGREWFSAAYQQRYGKKPGVSSDTAYDVIMLYARAIEVAKTLDIEKVRQALADISSFDGASGDISFDPKGGVPRTPQLMRVGPQGPEIIAPD